MRPVGGKRKARLRMALECGRTDFFSPRGASMRSAAAYAAPARPHITSESQLL